MKLCGFEVGLNQPLFVIGGRTRKAEEGPQLRWGSGAVGPTLESGARPADRKRRRI